MTQNIGSEEHKTGVITHTQVRHIPFRRRYMHSHVYIILLSTFLMSCTAVSESEVCGIRFPELEKVDLTWYAVKEREKTYEIAFDQALVWEYSNSEYCQSEEYLAFKAITFNKGDRLFLDSGSTGLRDSCQFRELSLIPESPIEFLTEFNTRIVSARVDGVLTTWYIIKNKAAVKFFPELKTHECIEYGA